MGEVRMLYMGFSEPQHIDYLPPKISSPSPTQGQQLLVKGPGLSEVHKAKDDNIIPEGPSNWGHRVNIGQNTTKEWRMYIE